MNFTTFFTQFFSLVGILRYMYKCIIAITDHLLAVYLKGFYCIILICTGRGQSKLLNLCLIPIVISTIKICSIQFKNYTAPTVGSTIPGSATVVGIVVVVVVVDLKIKLCRVHNMISLVLDMIHRAHLEIKSFSHDIRPLIVKTDGLSPSFKNRFQKSVRYTDQRQQIADIESKTLSPTGYAVRCIAPLLGPREPHS